MAKKPENDWMSGPYTGPVFRKFEGLDKVPQTSIGFLTRLSRKMTDYGMGMMNFSGARHFNLSRKFFLNNGDTGYIHTIINRGVDGAPMVLSRVTLDARYEAVALPPIKQLIPSVETKLQQKRIITESIPLFYYYDSELDAGYVIHYGEDKFIAQARKYEMPYSHETDTYYFWTGRNATDVAVIVGKSLYGANAQLVQPLPEEHSYRGTFKHQGTYYVVTTTDIFKITEYGELESVYEIPVGWTYREANRSGTQVLMKGVTYDEDYRITEEFFQLLDFDEDSLAPGEKTDVFITIDWPSRIDYEIEEATVINDSIVTENHCSTYNGATASPSVVTSHKEQPAWEVEYYYAAVFIDDELNFTVLNETGFDYFDDTAIGMSFTESSHRCYLRNFCECFIEILSPTTLNADRLYTQTNPYTRVMRNESNRTTTLTYPSDVVFSSSSNRLETEREVWPTLTETYEATRDMSGAECIWSFPFGCFIVGEGPLIETYGWSSEGSYVLDTACTYEAEAEMGNPIGKFGLFYSHTMTREKCDELMTEEYSPYDIKYKDAVVYSTGATSLSRMSVGQNNTGAVAFTMNEDGAGLAFAHYEETFTDLTDILNPPPDRQVLIIPLRATTLHGYSREIIE